MDCPFCHKTMELTGDVVAICRACSTVKVGVGCIISSYSSNRIFQIVFIVYSDDYSKVENTEVDKDDLLSQLMDPPYIETGTKYFVTMYPDVNKSKIESEVMPDGIRSLVCKLDGLPFTPENIVEKLKLYILLS